LTSDICTTNFVQPLWQPFFSLFLLHRNNRERKKKRENKKHVSMRETVVSKIVKKWLYKYHFSKKLLYELICSIPFLFVIKYHLICLEVLTQLSNVEIAKLDIVIRVWILNLTVVCGFNFSGLSLYLRQKKTKYHLIFICCYKMVNEFTK